MVAKLDLIHLQEFLFVSITLEKKKILHIRLLFDRTRVSLIPLRYVINSLVTSSIDYLVFIIIYTRIQNVSLSILAARTVSVLVNFVLLRNWVFNSRKKVIQTFLRFIILVAFFGTLSSILIQTLVRWFQITVLQAKIAVEITLYLIIYFIMKGFVFLSRSPSNKSQ